MSIKNERDITPNYGLIKPKQTDFYNVDDFNENINKIDEQIKVNADSVVENSNQIKNLSSPYVISEDTNLPVQDRVKGKLYFKVTSRQSGGS